MSGQRKQITPMPSPVYTGTGFLEQYCDKGDRVGIVQLGCVRNLVDGQQILGRLQQKGCRIVGPEEADVVILNTCGFIESAKKESIDALLDLIQLKKEGKIKKILVAGCLAQRYKDVLQEEFKEVDAMTGINPFVQDAVVPQIPLTPKHYAYLRICESCYNHCSFCAIPHIKGPFRSRTFASIREEAKLLDRQGVREINVVGQDVTAYGMDLYKEKKLAELLKMLLEDTKHICWFRLLYAYPSHLTEGLVELMTQEPRICRYLDLPLQHINDRVLRRMNRRMTSRDIRSQVEMLRSRVPGLSLRTSFIVGFPGETDDEFKELLDFVKEAQFERMGAFIFSPEEGTPAYRMSGQVSESVKRKRFDRLMRVQREISSRLLQEKVGAILRVLVDEKPKPGENVYIGRTEHDAPDADGLVYVHARPGLGPGDLVDVKITGTLEYDLVGEQL